VEVLAFGEYVNTAVNAITAVAVAFASRELRTMRKDLHGAREDLKESNNADKD
jgi:hypothetical protein